MSIRPEAQRLIIGESNSVLITDIRFNRRQIRFASLLQRLSEQTRSETLTSGGCHHMSANDPPADGSAVGISFVRELQRLEPDYSSAVVERHKARHPVGMFDLMRPHKADIAGPAPFSRSDELFENVAHPPGIGEIRLANLH